ncbi:MAG TPA: nicotinate phosphoribosyltransferase [Bacteroidales bacterium]|nr:nicotinate phosphoribosyltransferase [Bacteroidales bacterium]
MIFKKNIGLYTDHYELTMAQGYFLSGLQNKIASFDYFFRKNPFKGGYVVFAGLSDLIDLIDDFKFDDEDCNYLENIGFDKNFIYYLKDFKFSGDLFSVREGEIVFPNESIIRVEGNIIETQLIESLLLNIINFQSLIATKAARMRLVAGERQLVDFGLRRAQGFGSIHASRAAMIGGFNSTSNVYSACRYGFESTGTMAHSWIQTYNDEIDAFREFVRFYPTSSILLVDTFDTIKKGIPNAIKIAKELEELGGKLQGIRLDSGDLAFLSKTARKMLDEEGLEYVKIVVSNQLDEHLIRSLLQQNAPIDAFGVGTSLVIGKDEGALDGVYKLAQIGDRPTMKISENISKMTLPGKKKIYRYVDSTTNTFLLDGIELTGFKPDKIYKIQGVNKEYITRNLKSEEIVTKVMERGKRLIPNLSVHDIASFSQLRLKQVTEETKRFENPHTYVVGIGNELKKLQDKLKEEI